jgi:hypothetical protein
MRLVRQLSNPSAALAAVFEVAASGGVTTELADEGARLLAKTNNVNRGLAKSRP